MTRPLSPAAQAVLDAMHRSYDHEPTRRAIAAEILRALQLNVAPFDTNLRQNRIRAEILAIAAELEGNS